ncbi:MAG TPA: HAMP domain-containing sensor histidine kinase [Nitrososphaera sp.]|nr:HAMP domain-containing sensor histidine kinase [Nitrososphaera sp.]
MTESNTTSERTEIWYGIENIISRSLEVLSKIHSTYDLCLDSTGVSPILEIEPIKKAYFELKNRGVKMRIITEITTTNISYCKEMMTIGDVRHLEGIKGNFVVADRAKYAGIANTHEGKIPQLISSNVGAFVEQQQYFFEMLWNKAIPAKQRTKEIEEGRSPEKLEIIEDTQKSIGRAFDIMNKTQKELLVLFATPRTFSFALGSEAANIYKKISEKGVAIKLLVPRGTGNEIEENVQMEKARQIASSINLRFSDAALNTRITIMISDRSEFMSWELRDDTLDDLYLAGGIATYSNIRSVASSYAIIFDNLWKITELAENLRTANIKLGNNEKAMKEFINIAAHEIRTPIQPILGLSQVVRDRILDLAKQLQQGWEKEGGVYRQLKEDDDDHDYYDAPATIPAPSDSNYKSSSPSSSSIEEIVVMLDVLNRNAKRLEKLTSNLLDVSRIENNKSLELSKENFDLVQEIRNVLHDIQTTQGEKADSLGIVYDTSDEPIMIEADKTRIFEVVSNLLRNAIRFTDSGTITITSKVEGKNATISVKDTGRSIDAELMPRLFTKFASKSETGTGLGLYLSKKIIEAHGGKMWAENNKEGKGATFTFTLPLLKLQPRQD